MLKISYAGCFDLGLFSSDRPIKSVCVVGQVTPGSAMFGGPVVVQKYKLHQSAPLWKDKFKNFHLRGTPRECFPKPRCGSRRACRFWNVCVAGQNRQNA